MANIDELLLLLNNAYSPVVAILQLTLDILDFCRKFELSDPIRNGMTKKTATQGFSVKSSSEKFSKILLNRSPSVQTPARVY